MRAPWEIGIRPSEITPEPVWRSRRRWLRQAALGSLALGVGGLARAAADDGPAGPVLQAPRDARWSTGEPPNAWRDITTYNNFYEFGTGKGDPAEYAGRMRLEPWTVRIDGAVRKPLTLDLDALRRLAPLEERVYRLRCVGAWSMEVPSTG